MIGDTTMDQNVNPHTVGAFGETPCDHRSSVVYHDALPRLIRWLGGRFREYPGQAAYRMKWGELSFERIGLAIALSLFSESHFSLHIHLLWMNLYIRLPFLARFAWEPDEIMESWGFSTLDGTMHFHWAAHSKLVEMPWSNWVQVSHDVRLADETWAPYVGSWEHDKEPDGRHTEQYPYRYLLRSGEKQERTATIYVERRTRKLRWLRALPFGRTTHCIDVAFSDEVGERSGSWKGGTIGCGYELRPDETPRECLKRMARDRRFE